MSNSGAESWATVGQPWVAESGNSLGKPSAGEGHRWGRPTNPALDSLLTAKPFGKVELGNLPTNPAPDCLLAAGELAELELGNSGADSWATVGQPWVGKCWATSGGGVGQLGGRKLGNCWATLGGRVGQPGGRKLGNCWATLAVHKGNRALSLGLLSPRLSVLKGARIRGT